MSQVHPSKTIQQTFQRVFHTPEQAQRILALVLGERWPRIDLATVTWAKLAWPALRLERTAGEPGLFEILQRCQPLKFRWIRDGYIAQYGRELPDCASELIVETLRAWVNLVARQDKQHLAQDWPTPKLARRRAEVRESVLKTLDKDISPEEKVDEVRDSAISQYLYEGDG